MRGRSRGNTLSEDLFDKDTNQAIDFEITLAALLATFNYAYTHPVVAAYSHIAAVSILGVTFVRRIAHVSTNADYELIRQKSSPFLEIAAVIAILTLLSTASYAIHTVTAVATPVVWFVLVTFSVFVTAAILEEKFFADYTLWWFKKFEQKSQTTPRIFHEVMCYLFAKMSYLLRSRSKSEMFHRGMSTPLSEGLDGIWDRIQNPGKSTIKTFIVVSIVFTPFFVMGYWFLGLIGMLAVLPAWIVRDHIRFWSLAYGDTDFERLTGSLKQSVFLSVLYVGIILSMYSSDFRDLIPL